MRIELPVSGSMLSGVTELPLRAILFLAFCLAGARADAQGQTDFRFLSTLNLEKKISPYFSITGMAAGTLTYDYQEIGFAWLDIGLKYRISRHFGVNVNYRPLWSRNLSNRYKLTQILYADLDVFYSLGRFSLGGTSRFQDSNFSDFSDSGGGSWLNRSKVNLRYKIDYYWQPFIETELFTPLEKRDGQVLPNQWRFSAGLGFNLNRYVKIEFYQQIQRQINRSAKNTNYLSALNWSYRF